MAATEYASHDRISLISYVTRVQFGYGAAGLLASELQRLNVRRPLLITDRGIVAAGLMDVLPAVSWGGVFKDTPSNPTEAAVRAARAEFIEHWCDAIVCFGGGSPIDLGKAVAVAVHHDGPLSDYALVNGGLEKIRHPLPPVVAVPTTAGTGSEIARAAVVIMDDGTKRVVASPLLVPQIALCDPELTLRLPPHLTAATGFDAIAHCVETFCSPNVNPPADAIALDGLRRAVNHIRLATETPGHRVARWEMLMASLQGGMAFQKGLGAVHALSHPLGELGLHHGTLNAILLPPVLEHNHAFIAEKLLIAEASLELDPGVRMAEYLDQLMAQLRMPRRLGELGVRKDQLAGIAAKAVHDPCSATNPKPMSEADYLELLESAL